MTEQPDIINMNIERYRSMLLDLTLDTEVRVRIKRLLAEAIGQLALAIDLAPP